MLAVVAECSVTCQVSWLGLCVHTAWLLSDPATVLEDEGTEYIERQAAILQYYHCMLVQKL